MVQGIQHGMSRARAEHAAEQQYDNTDYLDHKNKMFKEDEEKVSPNYRANTGFNQAFGQAMADQDFENAYNKYKTGYGGETKFSAYVGPDAHPPAAHIMPVGPGSPASGYGGDATVSPYRIQPISAGALSPSTTPAGRVAIGQSTIAQPPPPEVSQQQIDDFFRAKSAAPEAMDPAVAAATNLKMKQDLARAGNPDLGNFGHIAQSSMLGGPQSSYGKDKAYAIHPIPQRELRQSVSGKMSPSEAALLDELSKRYISPEEMAKR